MKDSTCSKHCLKLRRNYYQKYTLQAQAVAQAAGETRKNWPIYAKKSIQKARLRPKEIVLKRLNQMAALGRPSPPERSDSELSLYKPANQAASIIASIGPLSVKLELQNPLLAPFSLNSALNPVAELAGDCLKVLKLEGLQLLLPNKIPPGNVMGKIWLIGKGLCYLVFSKDT